MDKSNLIIAIDGPAGAGKSTVSRILAQKLGLRYLDTGAMYRVLALIAQQNECSPTEANKVVSLAKQYEIRFGIEIPPRVYLDAEDVTSEIRSPDIAQLASELSSQGSVRRYLAEKQQAMVKEGGYILEGRDVTTVIAPHADLKVYLTASLEERAKRRLKEFQEKGLTSNFVSVRGEIEERDHRDITRKESPLSVASDAIIIDSANMTIQQVTEQIEYQVRKSFGVSNE